MSDLDSATAEPDRKGPTAVLDRGSELRFLLIEDSPSDREFVRALLGREFPRGVIDVAARLDVALELLAQNDYDLVLADLGLPDAQGADVVHAVRGARPQTALMVLTGRADEALALSALAEGVQDYLVKGEHDGTHLAEALLHGLQRNRTEQEARSHLAEALRMEREAVERLRELNNAKDLFVRTASHELRTPLTSVMAYAEMLLDEGGLTPAQEAGMDVIQRNAERLVSITDDLLVLATSTPGASQLEPIEVDLREVVCTAREVVAGLGTDKDLAVRYDLPDHPVLVAGDARQLERVLINLFSNAIKFTDAGGAVSCRLTSTPVEAVLSVSDTGIGIPLPEQGRLFESFFRGSEARSRAIQGTGLGLHIAASIVRDHQGEISVDSVAGVGSTFTVRLPVSAVITDDRSEGVQ